MDGLNANGLRAAGYALAAVVSVVCYVVERRRRHQQPNWWPTFWLITASVLAAMSLGRLLDINSLTTTLGRQEAVSRGWYEDRRVLQAAIVGSVGFVWAIAVGLVVWLSPDRRRRYLPPAVVAFFLLGFAAVRVVSLHQVDAVLHRHDVGGVRIGTIVELIGLTVAVAVPLVLAVSSWDRSTDVPEDPSA